MSEPKGIEFNHPLAAHLVVVDAERAILRTESPRHKVAIVGFATSSRDWAPYNDGTWEIWGLNQLYRHIPRADRWFEIHANWNEHVVEGTDHAGWLKASPIPIYMTETHEGFPNVVRYPLEAMKTKFAPYFTSTISYMLALAIHEVDEAVEAELELLAGEVPSSPTKFLAFVRDLYSKHTIGLFGIDLIVGTEWAHQKPCVEFLTGQALARGIELLLPETSALLKGSHLYGYELEPAQYPIALSMIQAKRQELSEQRDKLVSTLHMIDGAINNNEYYESLATLRLRGGAIKG